MEGLNEEFILSGDEIVDVESLFTDNNDDETQVTPPDKKEKETKETDKTTEDETVNPDDLFSNPEGVGSEEDNQEKDKEDTTSKEGGTSPKTNFYSSIATALKDEGILPDLDDEIIKGVKTPEDFAEAIDNQIKARLDERQRRIDEALNAEVEPDEIRQFEGVLAYLDNIKEADLSDETEKGENIRKKLIFQDYINRGYSKERAQREVKKSFDSGTDIEDAKEALEGNKSYFTSEYKSVIEEANKEVEAQRAAIKKEAEQLKKSMLEDKEVFEGITLDSNTRKKAFENITKPVFRTEDGEYLTTIQKYEMDNPVEFRKYLSVLFTLTDGFKNINGLIKGKVNKEVKQSIKELEHTLSRTSRTSSGDLKFVGDTGDSESYIGKGLYLDV
jgi:hypothetical protein